MQRMLRYAYLSFLAATAMAAFTTCQVYLQMVLRDNYRDWVGSFLWNALIWYSWVPLIPFVIALSFRYPLERGHYASRIALLVSALFGFLWLHALLAGWLMNLAPGMFGMPSSVIYAALHLLGVQAHWGFMTYVCTVALVHVTIYMRRAQAETLAREALRTEAANAQLSALQRQMQPHFLFNALNALVSMLEENSPAQRFTIRLADMLRVLLENSDRPTATLAEELALVNAYLEIERARLGARLRTDIRVTDSLLGCRLPALILQPLVENAIRHSISRTFEGGEISLSAHREPEEVRIEISNTCPPNADNDESGTRMTLPNCRRRLALMYGPAARFDAGFAERNLFRATIILPVGAPPALQPA